MHFSSCLRGLIPARGGEGVSKDRGGAFTFRLFFLFFLFFNFIFFIFVVPVLNGSV